ncbi:MAG TPA: HEAT repeat domain-containing protein [Pyrinomonadaceae bacterium]|nr:HEAT repeat domain-containing protein [Pyrinomonadaceae bacterium]
MVASPGDMQAERDALPRVLDEVNRVVAADRDLRLEVSRWETDAYPGLHTEGPPGLIDPVLKIEESDILIVIFGNHFGTPTKDAQSGTEHEFRLAHEAWRKQGSPQIMLYFRQFPVETETEEERRQRELVERFRLGLPPELLYASYRGRLEFDDLVRNHLSNFLRERFPIIPPEERGGRSLDELIETYRTHLAERLRKVYLLGESQARELEQVFVELDVVEEYRRPSAHTEYLGLMDAEMRRRRELFGDEESEEEEEREGDKVKLTIKPDALLRGRAQAVITGAPGCGKTTLLRYLALKIVSEGKRLPVFLELKTVTEEALKQSGNDLAALLFDKAIAAPLHLRAGERKRLEEFFYDSLAAGSIAVFLDGLDEVSGTDFFPALSNSIRDFTRSAYGEGTLVISTRPYALRARFEGLREMEVAPLSQRQVEEFLKHYYGDDSKTTRLLQAFRRNSQLRELASVPFLLAVVAQLHRTHDKVVENRLELYRQIVLYLAVRLDEEKALPRSHFSVPDPDGSFKLAFLRHLAFERLLLDDARDGGEERVAARFVFTGELLLDKAKRFLEEEKRAEVNPHLLAADAKATPLLREVGADAYAFAHLTIQEYLAADALSRRADRERIFCRASFDTTLIEMEVLPMALGLVSKPEALYTALEQLPESLNFANLRLRGRGLAYAPEIGTTHTAKLADALLSFVAETTFVADPVTVKRTYKTAVLRSFHTIAGRPLNFIANQVASLLHHDIDHVRQSAVEFLGRLGGERAFEAVVAALEDKDDRVRAAAIEALGQFGGEVALKILTELIKQKNWRVWRVMLRAIPAIGKLGGERAVATLLDALKDEDMQVREEAAGALRLLGGERTVAELSEALRDETVRVCQAAAQALGDIGGERAAEALIGALHDETVMLHTVVARALGKVGGDAAIEALIEALRDQVIQYDAALALGEIGGERALTALLDALTFLTGYPLEAAIDALGNIGDKRAVEALIPFLRHRNSDMRQHAVTALEHIGDPLALDALIHVSLPDENDHVRKLAVEALGKIGDPRAVEALVGASSDQHPEVRGSVAEALGELGDERAVGSLVDLMRDDEPGFVQIRAIIALGKIGGAQVVGLLTKALSSRDNERRGNIVHALKEAGGERAMSALVAALADEDKYVSLNAAFALGEAGGKRAVIPLLKAWQFADFFMCRSAASTLQELHREALTEGLAEALGHKDDYLRQRAAEVIGYYSGDPQVLMQLARMASRDRSREVRRVAGEALDKFKHKLEYFA